MAADDTENTTEEPDDKTNPTAEDEAPDNPQDTLTTDDADDNGGGDDAKSGDVGTRLSQIEDNIGELRGFMNEIRKTLAENTDAGEPVEPSENNDSDDESSDDSHDIDSLFND